MYDRARGLVQRQQKHGADTLSRASRKKTIVPTMYCDWQMANTMTQEPVRSRIAPAASDTPSGQRRQQCALTPPTETACMLTKPSPALLPIQQGPHSPLQCTVAIHHRHNGAIRERYPTHRCHQVLHLKDAPVNWLPTMPGIVPMVLLMPHSTPACCGDRSISIA